MRATILVLGLVLALCAPATADTEVSIGSTTRALRSASADALTGDSLDGGALTVARRLHVDVLPGLAIWADAGWAWGDASGTLFETMSTQLGSIALTVGGRARYELHPRLAASARVDLGAARAWLTLDDGAGHSASDHGWGATVAGALGVELVAVANDHFRLGLRFELGYVSTSGVALTAHPASASDGTLQLQMTAASLGHLDLSGPSAGVAVVSQF